MDRVRSRFIQKRDFSIRVTLDPDNPQEAAAFADAVAVAKPSFLVRKLILEVYQPLVGNVHETVRRICHTGIKEISLRTLVPGHPDLVEQDDYGQIIFRYEGGRVVDQYTTMSRDIIDAEDFMVHYISLEFQHGSIVTNEWCPEDNILRPKFGNV